MQYGEFLAALRQRGPVHAYLLAGEEPYFIKRARRSVLRTIAPDEAIWPEMVQSIDGDIPVPELIERLTQAPLFTEKSVLLLSGTRLFNETKKSETSPTDKRKGRMERDMDRLLALLTALPTENYVIFEAAGKADKRRRIYKTVQKAGLVLDADPVTAWNIDDWLREKLVELGREFDREARAYFMGAVSMMRPISLSFLDEELTKLALYTDARRFTRADLEQAFSRLPEVSGFALFDAIDARDIKRALMLLERQIADGVFLPLLLAGLARHVRVLWQAKEYMTRGVSKKALAAALEIHPYIAAKAENAAGTYDDALLHRILLHLADADYALKTGKAGPEVLEEAVIALSQRGGGKSSSRPFQTARAK